MEVEERCRNTMLVTQSPPRAQRPTKRGFSTPTSFPPASDALAQSARSIDVAAPVTTILSLPSEILCRIFELLPTFECVANLALSAKSLYSTLLRSAVSILRHRTSNHSDTVFQLAALQIGSSPNLKSSPQSEEDNCPATHTMAPAHVSPNPLVARLLNNESRVSSAYRRFSADLAGRSIYPHAVGYLSGAQRERFHAAYYRHWVQAFDVGAGGGLKHGELDLRSLFVRDVLLRRRRR